jgi:hypothetical protein
MARMAMAALRFILVAPHNGSTADSFFTGSGLVSIDLPPNFTARFQAPPATPPFVSTAAMHTLLPQRGQWLPNCDVHVKSVYL